MTDLLERLTVRQHLQLRYNAVYNSWQVFTKIHGQQVYRWININKQHAQWYWDQFKEIREDCKVELVTDGAAGF